MSRFRRLLVVAACAIALAASGCVEITNPEFDARYRSTIRPLPKIPYAVFAVYHEPSPKTPRSSGATILVVDTVKNSVVSSLTLDGVVAISDVGTSSGSVLAVLDDGFAQVNLRTAEATRLPTAKLEYGTPEGAGFDDKGIRVFWQLARGAQALVTRRVGANEQTAGVTFRRIMSRYDDVTDMYLMSANEREAYFLARYEAHSPIAAVSGMRPAVAARVLRVDFATHSIAATGNVPIPWPEGFSSAEAVHVDRAIRRWGLPMTTADGSLAFVSLGGTQRAMPLTSTVGPYGPQVVFEPDGAYLQVRHQAVPFGAGSMSWAVAEGSVGATGTHVVYQQELPTPGRIPIDPLGVIDDAFAFGVIRPGGLGTGEASAAAGVMRSTYDLHLRGVEQGGRDVVVASIPSPSDAPRADYLGTYTPPTK